MPDRKLYRLDYALICGETMNYGHTAYTTATTKEKAMKNFRYKLGRDYKRMREPVLTIVPQQQPAKQELPGQLSFF